MYYLLMLLVGSVCAAKTPNPDWWPASKASVCVLGSGFQSLIFNPEDGLVLERLQHEFS
jgi:hypothetical protein